MSAAAALPFRRSQPALAPSVALSALVHLLLIAVLFLGVRFQSQPSQSPRDAFPRYAAKNLLGLRRP